MGLDVSPRRPPPLEVMDEADRIDWIEFLDPFAVTDTEEGASWAIR